MLFKFLRQYFYDDEFEKTKIQLAESKALLNEYKTTLQDIKNQDIREKEKIDPDFLVMIWASIGLALSIGTYAASELPKITASNISNLGLSKTIWLVVALYIVFYISLNGMFAMTLTLEYAKAKKDNSYRWFAITLIAGIALLFIGLIVIAQFGKGVTP